MDWFSRSEGGAERGEGEGERLVDGDKREKGEGKRIGREGE